MSSIEALRSLEAPSTLEVYTVQQTITVNNSDTRWCHDCGVKLSWKKHVKFTKSIIQCITTLCIVSTDGWPGRTHLCRQESMREAMQWTCRGRDSSSAISTSPTCSGEGARGTLPLHLSQGGDTHREGTRTTRNQIMTISHPNIYVLV